MAGRTQRAPEVVQTSWLDCGPAALTSLLRGFGASAPYERLRTMCNTGIDGTSIDSIEAVAVSAGLDAVQMVVPVEQMLAVPEEYVPGIVVTVLPDGFAHFVVLWDVRRRRVALMDPASGRRTQSRAQFVSDLYTHDLEVPAEMWRDWAGGPEFREGLVRRCTALGIARNAATDLLNLALEDEGPQRLAALDAAIRSEERSSGRTGRGPIVSERLRTHVLSDGEDLEPDLWSCVIPEGDSTTDLVTLRGAVVLRAKSWNPDAATAATRAQLQSVEPRAIQPILDALKRVKWLLLALPLAALATAIAQASELLLFQSLLGEAALPFGWAIAMVLCSTAVLGLATVGALALGRHLDGHVRSAWMSAPRLLPSSFIRSRPVSDILFRAHSTHRLRDFPPRAVRFVTAALIATVATVIILVVAPQTSIAAAVLIVVAIASPWAFSRALAQADLRAQTLSGCLARPVTDTLLGAQALRQRGAAPALLAEHDVLAAGWERAIRRMTALTGLSRLVTGVAAAGALAWCLALVGGQSVGLMLMILVLGILIVDAGSTCAQILQTLPSVRSTLLRQSGPLNAVHVGRRPPTTMRGGTTAIVLRSATVRIGSVEVLHDVNLVIPKGAHVAVVGSSGSGKSTLLSVVLGTTELSEGTIDRAVAIDLIGTAWAAPITWLWAGDVRANVEFAASASAASAESRLALTGTADPARLADREVGEGGALLSDGEAQRVRLARALGRPDAPLVVLDEAMRGLPRRQRVSVLQAARGVWSKATMLCALHEIADATTFDFVIVMERGEVVEFGTPDTLTADVDSRFSSLLEASAKQIDGWDRVTFDGLPRSESARALGSDGGKVRVP